MIAPKEYPVNQFKAFRILLGTYVAFYAIALLPYAKGLYSSEGYIQDQSLNWTWGLFPSILYAFDSPVAVYAIVCILAISAMSFACGWWRRTSAVLAVYILVSLFNKNNLTGDPSMSFIYLLLLITAFIPNEKEARWKMPSQIYTAALTVLSVGYFVGGLLKIASPLWRSGDAMGIILSLPNARFGVVGDIASSIPLEIIFAITWTVIMVELLAPIFLLSEKTRFFWWALLTAMHVVVLITFTITQVSIGMLLYHMFIFDKGWIRK